MGTSVSETTLPRLYWIVKKKQAAIVVRSGAAAVSLARLFKLKVATDGDELRLCRPDLRKGFAFPEATSPKQLPPGRLEG
jgi:hypothetical protein